MDGCLDGSEKKVVGCGWINLLARIKLYIYEKGAYPVDG